jgi:hypothetical protein
LFTGALAPVPARADFAIVPISKARLYRVACPLRGKTMLRTIALIGLAAVAASPAAALAQTGTSSSWGSYGAGPQIPTQALTPRDRSWNFDHQAQNQAIAGSEWIREHAGTGQHSFLPF